MKVVVFYDDGMAVGEDRTFVKRCSDQMHCDLLRAGLVPGIEKCCWQPVETITWNGLVFNFAEKALAIKPKRIEAALVVLKDLTANWPGVTYRLCAKIIGMLISMAPVFGGSVQLKTRMLQNFVNMKHYRNASWDADIFADYAPMYEMARQELLFWADFLCAKNRRLFVMPVATWIVWTDASDIAIAGFVTQLRSNIHNHSILSADNWLVGPDLGLREVRSCARLQTDALPWLYRDGKIPVRDIYDLDPAVVKQAVVCHRNFRNLSTGEKAVDSNERELMAAQLVFAECAELMSGSHVTLYTDSNNAATILTKGSPKPRLHKYAENVFDILRKFNISATFTWIPRDLNTVADLLTRFWDADDYSVTREFFRTVQLDAGAWATIDCFASESNAQLARFFSPTYSGRSMGVDAFAHFWSPLEICWLFPPISMVGRAVNFLRACKGRGLLLIPQWKTSYFYPLLRQCFALSAVRKKTVYEGKNCLVRGSDPTSCFGPEFMGNLEVWYLDFGG